MDVKTRNKQVKAILSRKFGRENVSVKNGRGTAWGWCDVELQIPKISDCQCQPHGTYCTLCRLALNQADEEAKKELKGIEFYSYTDDMGLDHKEVIIQTHFKN